MAVQPQADVVASLRTRDALGVFVFRMVGHSAIGQRETLRPRLMPCKVRTQDRSLRMGNLSNVTVIYSMRLKNVEARDLRFCVLLIFRNLNFSISCFSNCRPARTVACDPALITQM